MQLLFLVVIVVAFYALLILPQNRRRKQAMALQQTIVAGSRIVTTSGMFGTVVELEDDALVVEIADGVEIRLMRGAVMRVVPEETGVFDAEDSDAEGAEEDDDGGEDDDGTSASDRHAEGGEVAEPAMPQSEAPLGWVGADATGTTVSGTDEPAAGHRGGRWRARSR